MTPYYDDGQSTIYHGDAVELMADVAGAAIVVTDPPYPNNAGHFVADVAAAEKFCATYQAPRWFVFWHSLATPPVPLPLVARHIWHRTNTNRPDNYEAICEFADAPERASRVFPYPVIFEGLTGCTEATGHPTQKNVRLMRAVLQLRKFNGFVLDPFMGSGTTLRAAKDLGFRAIGIEREERWCEVAARRLAQEVLMLDLPEPESFGDQIALIIDRDVAS